MKKISVAFKEVFAGSANNHQFIIVFFTLAPIVTVIVLFIMYNKKV